MKIYKIDALFEDYESTWIITIGTFNDLELANTIKDKWERFFKESQSLLMQPEIGMLVQINGLSRVNLIGKILMNIIRYW